MQYVHHLLYMPVVHQGRKNTRKIQGPTPPYWFILVPLFWSVVVSQLCLPSESNWQNYRPLLWAIPMVRYGSETWKHENMTQKSVGHWSINQGRRYRGFSSIKWYNFSRCHYTSFHRERSNAFPEILCDLFLSSLLPTHLQEAEDKSTLSSTKKKFQKYQNLAMWPFYTLQGKSHFCIPFLGIARPQS